MVPQAKVHVVTPARLGRYLEKKLADDRHLRFIGVQGEVSNLSAQANGNVYFSLKDRDAVLECVAFAERAAAFPAMKNGADVIAYGEVKIWARNSRYQLVAVRLELAGIGVLHAKYEELSRKLQREGLFDDARKRPLPRYPFRVALVGSPTGDGTRDFLTQARERAPHVAVTLFETPVAGVAAVPNIVRAIGAADAAGADVIVVVRGGGSYEDLFGFSDERVVRAIARCTTPTAAAIGHERDQPLIELVADVRASTPSKAAQTVLPSRNDLVMMVGRTADAAQRAFTLKLERSRSALERIEQRSPIADASRLLEPRRQIVDGTREKLGRAFERGLGAAASRLRPLERRLSQLTPAAQLEKQRGSVERLGQSLARLRGSIVGGRRDALGPLGARLTPAARNAIERRRSELAVLRTALDAVNPDIFVQRGYATIWAAGRLVRDPAEAPPGTRIEARLARGTLHARVEAEGSDGGEQIRLL
jgi:exodeoxyribonuclease VII large subunit